MAEVGQAGRGRSNARVVIRETPEGLGIYNPPRRNMSLILFLLLWLGGWAAGEYFAITEIMRGGNLFGSAFLLVWLTIWTFGGVVCWWIVLWSLFGSERLFVTSGALVKSRGFGPLRWRSIYPVDAISDLRINAMVDVPNAVQVPAIEFEFAGKPVRFGLDLDRDERQAVLAALRAVLPERAFQPKSIAKEGD